MRDIKFRAYSKSYKKMFDNEILERVADVMYEVGKSLLSAMGEYEAASDLQRGIYLPTKDEDLILMQYTGLKDKNDKEIYEGDIFYTEYDCNGVERIAKGIVEYGRYKDIMGCFKCDVGFYIKWDVLFLRKELGYYADKCEIKGNIYENQELLK